MITIVDFETTGLIRPDGNSLASQPHATQVCAVQIGEMEEVEVEVNTYIKPPISIPEHITKITRINDYTVQDAPTFGEIYLDLADAFFGSHTVIGHNITFDMHMLIIELKRLGKEFHFPYPPIWYCTIEQSMHLKGYRLKNGELFELATGKELIGAHDAKVDIMATYESYKWLKAGGGR